jgi:hypothetical protein
VRYLAALRPDVICCQVPRVYPPPWARFNALGPDDLAALATGKLADVVAGHRLQFPSTPVAIVGAVLCLGLRPGATRRGWELPVAPRTRRAADAQVHDDQSARR